MKVLKLEAAIKKVDEELKPILAKRRDLTEQLAKEKSIAFIDVNHLKKRSVLSSNDPSVRHWGLFSFFKEQLQYSNKDWCEWNGKIYLTSEILKGHIDPDACGRYEDLTN